MSQVKFSSEVEKVLAEVHQGVDEFDDQNFSVVDFINTRFTDQSTAAVEGFLSEMKDVLAKKKHNLISAVRKETNTAPESKDRLLKTKQTVDILKNRVKEIREKATSGEETVKGLSMHIRELDIAKSNITRSINTLRSIEMWMLQLHYVASTFEKRKYVQTRDALQEALKYQKQFSNITDLPRVKELNDRQHQQCNEMEYYIRNTVFGEVNWDSVNEKELAEVCALVDLMNEDSRNKIRDRFIEKALESYATRFKRGTEDAKLERTERRYVYIRTLLEHFDSMFSNVFPRRWCVPQELCVSFCIRTKQELDYQLRESSGKMDVVVLTYVLQKTIDIEKDLTQMMTWREDFPGRSSLPFYKYNGLILSAFKEHMHLFVQNEDILMGNALEAHPLIGEGENEVSAWNNEQDDNLAVGSVLPLAEDIFIFISQSLKRSLRISQPEVLLDMSAIWRKYLLKLSQDMLSVLPTKCMTTLDIRRACLIVNTARFCQTTSQDLGREIVARSEASTKDVAFDSVSDEFAEVYSRGIHALVQGLSTSLSPLLSAYGNGSFITSREISVDGIPAHDESQPIRVISSVLHDFFIRCCNVLPISILRFVVEKMAANVIPAFVGCLYIMKKMPDDAINIMRVDALALEKTVLQLPNYNDPDRYPSTTLTSFSKLVRREFGHLHRALKILQLHAPIDVFMEVYYEVMLPEDRSIQNFVRLAELKDFRRDELRPWISKLSNRGVVEATKRDIDRETARGLSTGMSSPAGNQNSQSTTGYSLFGSRFN